ncbi:MAG: hypothetical protein KJ905_01725 [Nanoarchaeota archaeon]|nr:hypothetical protein [Nanoarchaeota archaeon]MBU1501473.1 hypothetical protein [Nanoarchaeota archaeon]
METKVKLPDELTQIISELGFEGNSEFIEGAIKDKILELKKQRFFKISDKILQGLRANKIGHKEILDNFEKQQE